MAVYKIEINERTKAGKSLLATLKSSPETVPYIEPSKHSALYRGIKSGLRDVRAILDGRQKEQTLRELLDEL
jgi:hypothetical protein